MSENDLPDGFDGYVAISVDPGPIVLIITVVLCALMLVMLPFLVSGRSKYQRRRKVHDNNLLQSNERKNSNQDGVPTRESNKQNEQSDDDDDEDDVEYVESSGSGTAGHMVHVILDSHPRSGRNKARIHRGTNLSELGEHHGGPDEIVRKKNNGPGGIEVELTEDGSASYQSAPLNDDELSVDSHDNKERLEDGRHSSPLSSDDVPFWKPAAWGGIFDSLLEVAEYDSEMKRIVRLALPFVGQSLIEGLSTAVDVALVGRFVNTRAMAAYVGVDMLIGLSASFLSGFKDSLQVLLSQAIGARNKVLAGQYMQINIIFFIVLFTPIALFWVVYMESILEWFGYDDDIVKLGVDFSRIYIFVQVMDTVSDQIHALLDVIDRENYSTIFGMVEDGLKTFGILMVSLGNNPTLDKIGLVQLLVGALGMFTNVMIVMYKGWFDSFLGGMVGTFAFLNFKAVKLSFRTSVSLCVGNVIAYGEWEMLTLLTRSLGQAEITAWALLGTLWDVVEMVTEAVASVAEVRVGKLMGAGRPEKAKLSAYKTIYLAVFVSTFFTSLLFILGDNIPNWMTTDATLQRMMIELIPLFGIGNIALALGTQAWTIVGSQGRYRLSTAVGAAGSWFVTIPLAVIMTVILKIDLQGQTAAVVIGYMASGTANSYILFTSDWEKLSIQVREDHDGLSSSDSDSSSGSSSSSSSSSDDDDQ